jgi:hypothetical protein
MASRGLRRRVVLQVSPKLSREARPMFTAGLQGGTAGSAPPPRRGATRKVLHLRAPDVPLPVLLLGSAFTSSSSRRSIFV